jgi:hypothetical protein
VQHQQQQQQQNVVLLSASAAQHISSLPVSSSTPGLHVTVSQPQQGSIGQLHNPQQLLLMQQERQQQQNPVQMLQRVSSSSLGFGTEQLTTGSSSGFQLLQADGSCLQLVSHQPATQATQQPGLLAAENVTLAGNTSLAGNMQLAGNGFVLQSASMSSNGSGMQRLPGNFDVVQLSSGSASLQQQQQYHTFAPVSSQQPGTQLLLSISAAPGQEQQQQQQQQLINAPQQPSVRDLSGAELQALVSSGWQSLYL